MKNMFEIAATNLKMAGEREDPNSGPIPSKLQPGDTGLVQNHTKGPFNPKYVGDYHVVSLKGNQVEVQPSIGGPTEMRHIKHVKSLQTNILNRYQIILLLEDTFDKIPV